MVGSGRFGHPGPRRWTRDDGRRARLRGTGGGEGNCTPAEAGVRQRCAGWLVVSPDSGHGPVRYTVRC
jgi:hypothetical protein